MKKILLGISMLSMVGSMEVSASMPSAFDSFVNMLNRDQLISFRDLLSNQLTTVQTAINGRLTSTYTQTDTVAGMPAAPADMQTAVAMASKLPHLVPQAEAAAPELTPEQVAAAERVRTLIQEYLHGGDFSLYDIGLSDAEAIALADVIKNDHSITDIYLIQNNIRNAGAIALADALKTNTSITKFCLRLSNIGDAEARAFAEVLKTNITLTDLSLSGNHIGDMGAKALAEALKTNITLTDLSLSGNHIGDMGAKALASALKSSRSTTIRVSLARNNISEGLKRELEEIAKSKGMLISFYG